MAPAFADQGTATARRIRRSGSESGAGTEAAGADAGCGRRRLGRCRARATWAVSATSAATSGSDPHRPHRASPQPRRARRGARVAASVTVSVWPSRCRAIRRTTPRAPRARAPAGCASDVVDRTRERAATLNQLLLGSVVFVLGDPDRDRPVHGRRRAVLHRRGRRLRPHRRDARHPVEPHRPSAGSPSCRRSTSSRSPSCSSPRRALRWACCGSSRRCGSRPGSACSASSPSSSRSPASSAC